MPSAVWGEEPKPRGRSALFFGVAFVLALVVFGSAAAAYLYFDRQRAPVTELPSAAQPDEAPPPEDAVLEDGPPSVAALAFDAGLDAGTDAGADAGTDAGADAGTDAGTDGGVDGGVDAGTDDSEEEESVEEDDGGELARAIRTANYQRNRGNLGAAETHYMRALRLDADNPRALAGLVRLNMARGSSSAAVRWARRLVAARPRNPSNHVLLGDALQRAGNRRAAVRSWQQALELSPGLRSARQRLGR